MCMAIPSRISAINGDMATVECFGMERNVSLMLMAEDVAVGDYVLVQSGAFAVEKVEAATAWRALAFLESVIGETAAAEESA